jgi:hypothetical protein
MSDPIENLLSRLEKVKQTGGGRWLACCPAHEDKSPSLAIRETDEGKILIKCFAGCSIDEVLSAVGMGMEDLFPRQDRYNAPHHKSERRPFPASDALRAVSFEALIVMAAGVSLLTGEPFTESERDRMTLAVCRIQAALDATGARHG